MDVKETGWRGVDWIHLTPLAGLYEYDNDRSGAVNF
jgi:hypothetical protein